MKRRAEPRRTARPNRLGSWAAGVALACIIAGVLFAQKDASQQLLERLKRCEISASEAKEVAESVADLATLKPEERAGILAGAGLRCSDAGRYDSAEPLLRKALTIREAALGPTHPDTVASLSNLIRLLAAKGDYAAAEPLNRRALGISEKSLGPDNLDTLTMLKDLAILRKNTVDDMTSEPLLRQALIVSERIVGPEHPSTAAVLNNLAELLRARGDYVAAEPLYRRALAVDERSLGPEHPSTAAVMGNLALLLTARGDYEAAEPLYRRALAANEKSLRPDHPGTATSLNNLALLLDAKGDRAAAEPLFRRAVAINEKALGPEHPNTVTPLNNLAALLTDKGDYEEAEPLLRRALSIRERVLGSEHPDTVTSVNNLAELLGIKGHYAAAESLHRRALAIRERVLGTEHLDTALSLNNLAGVLARKGDYAAAEPLLRRALATSIAIMGPEHPNTVTLLYNGALLLWMLNQFDVAGPVARRASHAEAANLSRWMMPFGEAGQRGLVQSMTPSAIMVSFHLAQPQDKEAEREALWALLQRKGRLQEIRALQQRLTRRQPELFERWAQAQRSVDTCAPAATGGEVLQTRVGATGCEAGSPALAARHSVVNEALMALQAAVPRGEQDLGVVEFDELLRSLRDGGWALVEIASWRDLRLDRPVKDGWGEKRYAAYVLFADGRSESADLGGAEEIDKTVAKLRGLEADSASKLSAVREAARELYEQTLGKLEEKLKGQAKLYIAADGDLGLVDFSSLVDRHGRWFIEDHVVVNLTSGRDLVRLKRAESAVKGTSGDYLVANPSFLFRDERLAKAAAAQAASSTKPTLSAPAFNCSAAFGKGTSWSRVGITNAQLGGFRAALPGLRVLERERAGEGVVKRINRPRSLWFVTHGFFCDNAVGEATQARRAAGAWDDPMARGALVLAGAEVGGTGDGEDGFFQSGEIVERDWEGTELVVLGACETALGVPSVGDGVYGMRRALALAGARSQVMTLWRVSQTETFELLQTFANLLRQGKGKAEALREAQRRMLKKNPHPHYWAGFHFSGDPAAFSGR